MKKIIPLVIVAVLLLCIATPAVAGGRGNGGGSSNSSGSIGQRSENNFQQKATNSVSNKNTVNPATQKAAQSLNTVTKTVYHGQLSVADDVYRGIERALENVKNPVALAALQAKLEGTSVSEAVYEAVYETKYGSTFQDYNATVNVEVNGSPLLFDVPPTIVDGSTMVPMRTVFEALGAEVQWDGNSRTVTGRKGDITVVLTVNSNDAMVNGVHKTLDLPATVIDGTSFVPVRFVSEALGAEVNWDAGSQTVDINTV